MKTLLIIALIALGLAGGYRWLTENNAALPADPVTAITAESIKSKVQAEVTLTIINLRQRMQRSLAAPESGEIAAIQAANVALHALVTTAQQQLVTLGDSQDMIDQWLKKLQWDEFITEEQAFNKSVTTN
jgi:predicted negative regulator of RcsB-dependent stress response